MSLVSMTLVCACAGVTLAAALAAAVLLGRREGRLRRTSAVVSVLLTATLLLGTLAASANVRMGWFTTTGDIWRTLTGAHGEDEGLGVVPLPAPGAGSAPGGSTESGSGSGGAGSDGPDGAGPASGSSDTALSDRADAPLPASLSAHPGSPEWTTSFTRDTTRGVWRGLVRGPASGLERSVTVWTPPGYSSSSTTTYDVVLFMHGFPGSDSGVVKALGVDATIRDLMAEGDLPPTIFVVADLSMGGLPPDCVDIRGRPAVETFLTQDLVQSIRTNFPHVSGLRSGWLIGGVSAGAYCAPVLYLRHQDQFWGAATLSGYDAPELGSLSRADRGVRDEFTISRMVAGRDRPAVRLWLSGTTNDEDSLVLMDRASHAGRPGDDIVTHVDASGGHSWRTWEQQFPLALQWWARGVAAGQGSAGEGITAGGNGQSGSADPGTAQSGTRTGEPAPSVSRSPYTAPPPVGEQSGFARAFALDGGGTLVASVLLVLGLVAGLVRVGPLTAWPGRGRVPGYLLRVLGVAGVGAVTCVCVIIIANRPQGFFSSWSDLLANWGMFF